MCSIAFIKCLVFQNYSLSFHSFLNQCYVSIVLYTIIVFINIFI